MLTSSITAVGTLSKPRLKHKRCLCLLSVIHCWQQFLNDMENKNYNYETKCRRCGNLTEWHFSTADRFTWVQFAEAMQDHIEHPRQSRCEKCEKETVQDVVAYSPVGGE